MPAKTKQNAPESTTRQVQASQVDIDFAPGPDRRPQAEHILAAGSARVNVHTIYAKTPPEDTTVQGDQLFATLVDGEVLSSLRGTGHTSLVTRKPQRGNPEQQGRQPPAHLRPASSHGKPAGKAAKGKPDTPTPQPAAQLQSAVQLGNVTLVQQGAATPGGQTPPPTTATAQRAAYDAATQVVQLSGNPRIQESQRRIERDFDRSVAHHWKCRCDRWCQGHLSPGQWAARTWPLPGPARCMWSPITHIWITPQI